MLFISGIMFNPGNQFSRDARSPPLHHPLPQHPIPNIHSPPNLDEGVASSMHSANTIHNPYQPAAPVSGNMNTQGGFNSNYGPSTAFSSVGAVPMPNQQGPAGSGFGGFQQYLNDPSAQIGLTVGRNALNYGQEYLGKNVSICEK